jgi:glycosyltransferase involved in cell wall biosynthesis
MFDISESTEQSLQLPVQTKRAKQRRIALVGNFPPRRCGIATFTADLTSALLGEDAKLSCQVVAMSDADYDYPDAVSREIRPDVIADYTEAARRLNADEVDLVCIQHEFGIFGGPAGGHLLSLIRELRCPIVTSLHTVLEQPNPDQRRVMEELIRRSAKIVVLSHKGREILMRTYGAAAGKVAVIPHGAPDRPLIDTADMKPKFGLEGRDVMLTFGLLSPGKGIEDAIRAMPRIVAARPNALYLVLGATHPHLVARDGETHRECLQKLAEDLGVADNVRFVNKFVDFDELCDYLQAADVYVTPYRNVAQIASGTLAYAVALGKPVVSTPYWHAAELLDDNVGVLTPIGDIDAIGEAVADLLSNDVKRRAMSKRAYAKGREMIWSKVAESYLTTFDEAMEQVRAKAETRHKIPALSLRAIERMSDGVGILQHARFSVPDRNHGYCVDDNARALILTQRASDAGARSPALDRLAHTYAAFVDHAWNRDRGRFRNFMSYDRSWLEEVGSEDSFGRSFWSLGETAVLARDPELRRWALHLAGQVLPHFAEIKSTHAIAFGVLALCPLSIAGLPGAREALERSTARLMSALDEARRPGWDWFCANISYDNARLPEALLRAGMTLDSRDIRSAGLETLTWLSEVHTAPTGVFRPVGSQSFGRPYTQPEPFDQQPLEAAAAIDACWAAFDITGDPEWRREAQRAFAWYLGENDTGARMGLSDTGGCYDGLGAETVNRNQGAESVLSFQLAACAMRGRERVRRNNAAC